MDIMKRLRDRRVQIWIVFSLVFIILGLRLAFVTITQGDYYREQSINRRLKQLTTESKRGEIRDRNGVLLAGNLPSFTVNVSGSTISKDELSDVAIKLLTILDDNGQAHLEFPIKVDNGQFFYTYDRNITDWLERNGYEGYTDANDLFDEIRKREQIPVVLTEKEAIQLLKLKGVYLPFSISSMKFYSQIEKERILEFYGLPLDIGAEEAFMTIRNRREFRIPEDMSHEDAYKVLTLKHDFKVKGYLKYEPIRVAEDVAEETAVLINELSISLPGVTVEIEPKRFYPHGSSASHILGYMGKIATDSEIETYVTGHDYDRNQLIGKVGLEGRYELNLNGEDGLKYIEVDALGKLVREVPVEELDFLEEEAKPRQAISGEDIQLTIDIVLQQKVETLLANGLSKIQEGGLYESQWGNYQYKESFPNAQTAAAVVVDVRNGEVLAMASYPDYDLNLFATGISKSNWDTLQPKNKRNPLSPRPLYNLATLTSVQPGSTYKMVTAYAALSQGLDPFKQYFSDGYVQIGQHRFGCWLWNDYGLRHGWTDLYKAIAVSCNYYFFDVATGYDFYKGEPLGFTMNTQMLLEYSKVFGLNDRSGIEIYESVQGIPDPDKKKRQLENALKRSLLQRLPEFFPTGHFASDDDIERIADQIVSWSDDNPSRGAIISRLRDMGVASYNIAEPLADLIKYSYFNQMEWAEGDALNLSIGQGGHQYTPIQMARYIATLANDGYGNELTLVQQVGDQPVVKNQNVTNEGITDKDELYHIRYGMLQATQSDSGTARIFKNFPIEVAAKTGTAEKEGRIPPADEIAYFKINLESIDPALTFDQVESAAKVLIQERTEEVASLQRQVSTSQSQEGKSKLEGKINTLVRKGHLSESSAYRQAIKDLSLLPLTDEDIDQYRQTYDNYAWFVSFGPYDNPEIAVVVMIPQGGHGGYGAPIARDIYSEYFNFARLLYEY